MNIRALLERMISLGASDLHLKSGVSPVARVHGVLTPIEFPPPKPNELEEVATQLLTSAQKEVFDTTREVDFAFGVAGLARFRANFFVQRGSVSMVFRHVSTQVPRLEELSLPPVLADLALRKRGLILVTGTTGSGKSTTLAAMIGRINQALPVNIISIEDPIEFLHRDANGLIQQREVGTDTVSFHAALRHILRQDPDVIMIGEIRDRETMEIALTAADTGHLVLSTLHTIDATQTINRIISFFEPHQHQEVRYLLASTLQAVVSQRLVRRADGRGRTPAVEVMVSTATICDYIRDAEKTPLIRQAVQDGVVQYGMQSFDQALMALVMDGRITREEGLEASSNPHELALRLGGVQASSDQSWNRFEATPSGLAEGRTRK
ncbi:MAG TPA: type IV pilus twitching motility protein PilT [Candidatus Krumholzibacteria bacterium]|nr:type IV pilus twitching motility protein PilT [Candidatus Krumholzibacteria bacterium]